MLTGFLPKLMSSATLTVKEVTAKKDWFSFTQESRIYEAL